MNPVNQLRDRNIEITTIDNLPVNALSHAVQQALVECIDAAQDGPKSDGIFSKFVSDKSASGEK